MGKEKIQNKYQNLLILTNRDKFRLPFGDYLRILAFVPNLKFKNFFLSVIKIYFFCQRNMISLIQLELKIIN